VSEVVSYPLALAPERWHSSCAEAQALLEEAGVLYRELAIGGEAAGVLPLFEEVA